MLHQRWIAIPLFLRAFTTFQKRHEYDQSPLPTIEYRAKLKQHGKNAGINIPPTEPIRAQSRSEFVASGLDGFAAFVNQTRDLWNALRGNEPLVVFGEWCGPGVQKGVAVSKLDRKIFCVFALQYGYGEEARIVYDPEEISRVILPHPDVFVLPWWDKGNITIDFADRTQSTPAVDNLMEAVQAVEQVDPWIKEMFGIEGMGEGIVLYPVGEHATSDPEILTRIMWKAKGKKHQTVGKSKSIQVSPTVVANAEAFAALMVMPARLEQGVQEACGGEFSRRTTGKFIHWMVEDVFKEGTVELEASGLTWEQVVSQVQAAARTWYLSKC